MCQFKKNNKLIKNYLLCYQCDIYYTFANL